VAVPASRLLSMEVSEAGQAQVVGRPKLEQLEQEALLASFHSEHLEFSQEQVIEPQATDRPEQRAVPV